MPLGFYVDRTTNLESLAPTAERLQWALVHVMERVVRTCTPSTYGCVTSQGTLVLRRIDPPKGVREALHLARESRVKASSGPRVALLRSLGRNLVEHARTEPHALDGVFDWLHEPPRVAWITTNQRI